MIILKMNGTSGRRDESSSWIDRFLELLKSQERKDKVKNTEAAEIPKEDEANIIYPGAFGITWSDDKNYWKKPDKKSKDPAELIKVCWLQVTGSKKVKTGKSYEIKFKISFRDDAFGWNGLPLFMMYKIGENGNSTSKKIKPLEETESKQKFDIPCPEEKLIVKIPGDKGDEEQELHFGFYETQSNKWKGGLRIHYATVKEVSLPN